MWGRVVVGVNGSLASLQALRQAVAVARREGAPLRVVWVFGPEVVGHVSVAASTPDPRLIREGRGRVADAFARALGGYPTGMRVTVDVRAYEGNPGAVLVELADRKRDLLVIGTAATRRWWYPHRHKAGRYCLRHARCPVLATPLSDLAQTIGHHPGQTKRLTRRLLQSVTPPNS